MKTTIGILAHVDAGKTTLSEQILFHTGTIRNAGRVDYQNSFMDNHNIEKERGITIFSDQAMFEIDGNTYYLLDTPGHVDFSAEMERAVQVMDYAILVISAVDGVQSHTETVWNLLKKYNVPVFVFLNKTDRDITRPDKVIEEIKSKLTKDIYDFDEQLIDGKLSDELIEHIASYDEGLLETYLDGKYDEKLWLDTLRDLVKRNEITPCFRGSALLDDGIDKFISSINLLVKTDYESVSSDEFTSHVYKIRHDNSGNRLTFVKVMRGKIRVKDEITYKSSKSGEIETVKLNELRIYSGSKFKTVSEAVAGDLCTIVGPMDARCGDFIGCEMKSVEYETTPMLKSKVMFDDSVNIRTMLSNLRILEEEDPMLSVVYNEELKEIHISIMGVIQLEILKEIIKERFGVDVEFGECEILYKETIKDIVIGYGHFEPLKHYAEVHLELKPLPRGSGIVFVNKCSTEDLDRNYQSLVKTHVFEREHRGVLTGSPITDIQITLLTGRAHVKHTEGGDFREATYRAIRQGLEQAESIILEPMYRYKIEVATDYMGRVLSDMQKMNASFDSPEILGDRVIVKGRCPAATMMNYNQELISYTRGRGMLSFKFDGYEECHNPSEVIERIGYDKERDVSNTSTSIFCKKGAGFPVKWYEVKDYIHIVD